MCRRWTLFSCASQETETVAQIQGHTTLRAILIGGLIAELGGNAGFRTDRGFLCPAPHREIDDLSGHIDRSGVSRIIPRTRKVPARDLIGTRFNTVAAPATVTGERTSIDPLRPKGLGKEDASDEPEARRPASRRRLVSSRGALVAAG